jgi:hypothetical protein
LVTDRTHDFTSTSKAAERREMWRRKELFLSSSVTAQRLKRRELSVLHPEVLKEEKFLPVWAGITTILIAGTLYLYKKGKVNF